MNPDQMNQYKQELTESVVIALVVLCLLAGLAIWVGICIYTAVMKG